MAYEMQYKKSTDSSWTAVPGTFTTTTYVTGLANGTQYDFQVRVSPGGTWSSTATATPVAPTQDVTVPATSSSSGSFDATDICTISFKRDSTGVYLTFANASWNYFDYSYTVNGNTTSNRVTKSGGSTTKVLITMPAGLPVTIVRVVKVSGQNETVWSTGYTIAAL